MFQGGVLGLRRHLSKATTQTRYKAKSQLEVYLMWLKQSADCHVKDMTVLFNTCEIKRE